MKKKPVENYLDRVPKRAAHIHWTADDRGIVTLEIENKGAFNRVAQKLLKKLKVSFVHLDETGSFVWRCMDGEKNLTVLGEELEAAFGEKAHPLYERLAKYVQILDSYGFVNWK